MPRIPGVVEPKGPSPVLDFARPRQISPARTREALGEFPTARPSIMGAPGAALADLGQAIARVGGTMLEHTVRQEISAETTRAKTEAARKAAERRAAIENAGTVADARMLLEKDWPKLEGELAKYAEERGIPEVVPELQLMLTHERLEITNGLSKQAAKEGAENGVNYVNAQEDAYAGARTPAEAERIYMQTSQEVQRIAATNPLVSPGDADAWLAQMLERGSTRRANGIMAARANDPAGLRELAAEVQNPLAFRGMPEDQRAILSERALAGAERQELHQLAVADAHQAKVERQIRIQQEITYGDMVAKLFTPEGVSNAELAEKALTRELDPAVALSLARANEQQRATVDEPKATVDMWATIHAGKGSVDMIRAASTGLYPTITVPTATAMLSALNSATGESRLSAAQKEVLDHVESQIVDKGFMGDLDFEAEGRLGNMISDGTRRLLAGEDREETRAYLLQTYRGPVTQGPGVYGTPYGAVTDNSGQLDLAATAANIKRARLGLIISDEEATRQYERLDNIKAAMLAQRKAMPTSEGRR